MSIVLSDIKTKNSLKSFSRENDLIQILSDELKTKFPNYTELRDNLELIQWLVSHIENAIKKGNSKKKNPINKKNVVVKILTVLIPGFNIELINKQIEFLHDNGLIKKIPLLWKYYKKISTFFLDFVTP